MLIARRVGQVYAIEASRESFDYLRVNCLLNRLDNAHPFHLALGPESGLTTLYHDRENWGRTTAKRLSHESETVPMATLTDFMAEQAIERCDFLRMNCEGQSFPSFCRRHPRRSSAWTPCSSPTTATCVSDVPLDSLVAHVREAGLEVEIRNRISPQHGWLIAFRRRPRAAS